ncbi:hypothetical protein [Streptomyces platensis]|uniref:hypothetical protein n=1 Tax=Streptomyces platensis TaxID=58346 RepID=UPI0036B26771
MASNQQSRPEIGDLAKDLQTGQTGVVMGKLGGRVQMRPLAGGREWDAKPDDVIPPGRTRGAQRTQHCAQRQKSGGSVMRAISRFAGVLFIITISASCGLVIGMSLALRTP